MRGAISQETNSRIGGRFTLPELAADMEVNYNTLRGKFRDLGIPLKHARGQSSGRRYVPRTAEQRLREIYSDRINPEDLADWPESEAAARMLALTTTAFLERRRFGTLNIERRCLVRVGETRSTYVYSLPDLRRAAAGIPVRPWSIPRGTLAAREMAALLGISGVSVRRWSADLGCPHQETLRGHRYYYPAQVLAWLSARPQPMNPDALILRERHEQRLALWIEEQK